MLNFLRFFLAQLAVKLGLTQSLREIYLSCARIIADRYLSFADDVFIRRSVRTHDFIPFLSDIDLTIFVSIDKAKYLSSIPKIPLVDLQIVGSEYKDEFLRYGGFRNFQASSWLSLRSNTSPQIPALPHNREDLSFQISHELYFLYQQLYRFYQKPSSHYLDFSKEKILAEILRLHHYWIRNEQSILYAQRSSFLNKKMLRFQEIFDFIQSFSAQLLSSIHLSLPHFGISPLIKHSEHELHHLYLHINSLPVIISDEYQASVELKDYFYCPSALLVLLKTIGVQEQTQVNELARVESYYYHYCHQRLLTDLYGSFLSSDSVSVYYCLDNINQFFSQVLGYELKKFIPVKEIFLQTQSLDWNQLSRLRIEALASLTELS